MAVAIAESVQLHVWARREKTFGGVQFTKHRNPSTTVAFDGVFCSVSSLRKPGGFVAIGTMRGYIEL
jgi:hypothetical protein